MIEVLTNNYNSLVKGYVDDKSIIEVSKDKGIWVIQMVAPVPLGNDIIKAKEYIQCFSDTLDKIATMNKGGA